MEYEFSFKGVNDKTTSRIKDRDLNFDLNMFHSVREESLYTFLCFTITIFSCLKCHAFEDMEVLYSGSNGSFFQSFGGKSKLYHDKRDFTIKLKGKSVSRCQSQLSPD